MTLNTEEKAVGELLAHGFVDMGAVETTFIDTGKRAVVLVDFDQKADGTYKVYPVGILAQGDAFYRLEKPGDEAPIVSDPLGDPIVKSHDEGDLFIVAARFDGTEEVHVICISPLDGRVTPLLILITDRLFSLLAPPNL